MTGKEVVNWKGLKALGMPLADICRKAGISQATYFNWKKKYDG
ncbi:MAG: transposase, partial [Candidatus Saccharimonadales bacterium]